MPLTYAIATQDLARSFNSAAVVKNLNLQVRPQSIYGFLGPNGAGKTTTIRMLLGLIGPDRGEISVLDLALKPNRKQILARVGAMVEAPAIYPHLTGKENLEVLARLSGIKSSRIEEALRKVELVDAANKRAGNYSQGMKQRLGLAMALLNDPRLLILDEPSNGLDPAGIRDIRELLKRLVAESGITAFISSHLLAEIEMTATELGIIDQGKLIFQGALQELKRLHGSENRFKTSDPPKSLNVAHALGVDCRLDGDGNLECKITDPEGVADLNRALVQAGVRVYGLASRESRLEDVFMRLTEREA
ncbi:MAG TPA: ABC transporter ATP-binding protein [Terriglobia bacterium]|nr:ABC transporter ATP-binding protein [Terriglobia bacterium]